MWLRLRGLSRPEDRFEAWIAQRHQERVLERTVTPAGPCPDEAFLKDLAKKSKAIALGDPRVDHAANCPICMRRLLALRREHHSRRLRLVLTAAVASCMLIAVLFVGLARHRANPTQQMAGPPAVLNPWTYGMPGRSEGTNPPLYKPYHCLRLW
jgi:hypothetical protein